MRKRGKRFDDRACVVNPLFSMSVEARNNLATRERVAMDALFAHKATAEDIDVVSAVVEASIRVIPLAKLEPTPNLDLEGLDEALQVFYRAAHAIVNAKRRHAETSVYGLDGADRAALLQADDLAATMRKPGVILRRTWIAAYKQAVHAPPLRIPSPEAVCL